VSELLRRDFGVTGIAEVTRVIVVISAAESEWRLMINHRRQARDTARQASLAEAVGAG